MGSSALVGTRVGRTSSTAVQYARSARWQGASLNSIQTTAHFAQPLPAPRDLVGSISACHRVWPERGRAAPPRTQLSRFDALAGWLHASAPVEIQRRIATPADFGFELNSERRVAPGFLLFILCSSTDQDKPQPCPTRARAEALLGNARSPISTRAIAYINTLARPLPRHRATLFAAVRENAS